MEITDKSQPSNPNLIKAYHELSAEALNDVLDNGLKRASRGDKGDDQDIIKTNKLLDSQLPTRLKRQSVSRDNNIYAYMCIDQSIIDITDGRLVPLDQFVASSRGQIIELTIDPSKCFVSDLDAFDRLKLAIKQHFDQSQIQLLVTEYWGKLIRLDDYRPLSIDRPEIMITYDMPASAIRRI